MIIFFYFLLMALATGIILALYELRRKSGSLKRSRDQLLQEKEAVVSFLHEIGTAFTRVTELDDILKLIVNCSLKTTNAGAGAIFLTEDGNSFLRARVIEGTFPPLHGIAPSTDEKVATKLKYLEESSKKARIAIGSGIIGGVARDGEQLLIEDGQSDSRIPKFSSPSLQIKTMMAVPLKIKNEIIGVMAVINKSPILSPDRTAPQTEGISKKTRNKAEEYRFTESDLSLLNSLAEQAAVSINNARFYEAQAEKQRLDHDLDIAKDIQQHLLPKTPPKLKGFNIAALNKPALKLGGDYFDFIPVNKDKIGLAIADVSGKGIPAALVMVSCRSILRSEAGVNPSPSQVLSEVNKHIKKDMKEGMFISMFYAILDGPKKIIRCARAGHEPAIHFQAKNESIRMIKGNGMVIGIDETDSFSHDLEESEVKLSPGDVVVLYTDGVTEAMDSAQKEFGKENLIEAIRISAGGNAKDILNNICERINRFTGGIPQYDDITLVVIKAAA